VSSAHRAVDRDSSELDRTLSCEHQFVTAQPHPRVRFQQAIERRAVWMAEDAAREMGVVSLHEAQQLVHPPVRRTRKSEVRARGKALAGALSNRGNAELEGRREGHGESREQAEQLEAHMAHAVPVSCE